jgi:hypothetical protein
MIVSVATIALLAQVAVGAPAPGPWWTLANSVLVGLMGLLAQRWRSRFAQIERKLAQCEAGRADERAAMAAQDTLALRVAALEAKVAS